jgi:N-acetylglucosaminyldiphosphoundecaprenol N-acetyl-beta-D-mannosaminyltransferase
MSTLSNTPAIFMLDRHSVTLPKFKILGQPINLADDYMPWLIDRLQQRIGTHVVTMNAEIVMQANHNPELANIIHQADLVTPDGSGIILALRLHGIEQRRCAGIELGEDLLRIASMPDCNYPVFFYGGKPEVVEKAAKQWQHELPDLNIVGIQHGYVDREAQAQLERELVATQPKIILVAMGVPRQEIWIRDHFHLCPEAVWVGVGGSFDVWSGAKKRAPQWIRNLNLEWCYRVAQEPSRWQRTLALPQFAMLAVGEKIWSKNRLAADR